MGAGAGTFVPRIDLYAKTRKEHVCTLSYYTFSKNGRNVVLQRVVYGSPSPEMLNEVNHCFVDVCLSVCLSCRCLVPQVSETPVRDFVPFCRNAGSDWRESARNSRQEEQEKALADKRKKLLRAIPTNIPGVSAVARGDARSDIREIEALVDMQVSYGFDG